ncbi:MAG: hypothetical protein K2X66_08200, partial [Cyanobacteria bacterium]|nr:hypothetical protein [Cyanobacteriota bacterium]
MMTKHQHPHVQHVTTHPLPNSKKVYVSGTLFPSVKVPMREIELTPSRKTQFNEEKSNPPVSVYDTSGPYTDPDVVINVSQGLAPLRNPWIIERNDTETYEGRKVSALDDGLLYSPESVT